jgi:hypothetical protein
MSWACRARRLSSRWGDERRWRERVAGLVLSWMAVVNFAGVVGAQEQATVVRVEEDWELVVSEPKPDAIAPQVRSFSHVQSGRLLRLGRAESSDTARFRFGRGASAALGGEPLPGDAGFVATRLAE